MPFAICRDGLLLAPEAEARFVPFADVEDGGYHNLENLKRAKAASVLHSPPLSIRLRSGEVIDLPVEVRDDGMSDLLTIAKYIHQRSVLYQPKQ